MKESDTPGVYLTEDAPEPGARSTLRGHPIVWDGEAWRFIDTGELTVGAWKSRPCGLCLRHVTPEGHDPCLGTLPGVRNACCGHGDPAQAYIQFETGMIVRGFCIDRAPPSPPRSPAMSERGDGNTMRQMMAAPRGSVYIWVNSHLTYPRALARHLGREDLEVASPGWLDSNRWWGRTLPGIVLDHAIELTVRQWDKYDEIRSRLEVYD